MQDVNLTELAESKSENISKTELIMLLKDCAMWSNSKYCGNLQ
jgi:hypothetical protein